MENKKDIEEFIKVLKKAGFETEIYLNWSENFHSITVYSASRAEALYFRKNNDFLSKLFKVYGGKNLINSNFVIPNDNIEYEILKTSYGI